MRKGSTTALDPHGLHSEINMNPDRSSSSTLTIVRVAQVLPLSDPPTSPQRRIHRRISEPTNRVSFAFSSFSSNPSSNKDQPPSPSSSPRLRPSSPHRSGSFSGKPRLTPDQLVDLARQATNPKSLAQPADLGSPSEHGMVTPATFTPLPDDIYLPFIDRPSEVAALISSPPDLKLFSLLAQTFSNKQLSIADQFPRDPIQWSYHHLIHHLTCIDRDIAPDYIWAIAARKCIHFHSELIWERVKGALGIPPELDIDYDFLRDNDDDPQSTTLNPDEGLDRGHWADWDSIVDSPVANKRFSFESPVAQKDEHDAPSSPPPTIQQATQDDEDPDYLSIEPLLAGPPSSASSSLLHNHPPLSLPSSGDGLGDIAEGAEEDEAELVSNTESSATTSGLVAQEGAGDPQLISPSQIKGLKITTSAIPSSKSFSTPPMTLSPISPLPPYPPAGATIGPQPIQSGFTSSLPHSRTNSFSSIGPFQRSESMGALAALRAAGGNLNYPSSVFTGSESGDIRERDGGYISDGDRLPGYPLFPSNFARLAMGPALRTKWVDGVDGQGKARTHSDAGSRGMKGIEVNTKRQSWGNDG